MDTKIAVRFLKLANKFVLNRMFLSENLYSFLKGAIMITGLKKWQKTTEIYFSEAKDPITISTFNTSLKNRLTEFARNTRSCVSSLQMMNSAL